MDRRIIKALSLITQLSFSMLAPLFLCLFAGIFLDRLLGVSPAFMLIFIILGVGAGFRSVYMLTKSFYTDKDSYIDINAYKGKEASDEQGKGD